MKGRPQNSVISQSIEYVFNHNNNIRLLKPNELNRKFDCIILLCGATGCGKSAILNSIVNFVEGRNNKNLIIATKVNESDELDPRFLINENKIEPQQTGNILYIQVIWEEKYFLFIDGPGYNENYKSQIDNQILNKIKDLKNIIKSIDCIFYVQKFTDSLLLKSSECFLKKVAEFYGIIE